ncbi:MAG TPA: hypothetical protein VK631_19825 [Solirubrobacteraceae bacterium]|nr:hypothetical protein [Solirubrobacteraceae bacterium]
MLSLLAWAAPAAAASAQTPALRDADYLASADGVLLGLGAQWDPVQGVYMSRHKGAAARTNANLLLVHATAALHGHAGPSRQDERARILVARMTAAPMFRYRAGRTWSSRSACWMKQLTRFGRDHVSVDSQVAEALAAAWRARRQLGLTAAEAARAAYVVDRCAHHPAWRFPHLLKNQFNWSAQLYAAAADVTGRSDLLRRDYRRHLVRFAAAITRPRRGMRSANLGTGFGFHYNPELPATTPGNFDTPEYALIVASALQYYPRALRAGMRPLAARELGLLRRWVTRLLTGSWTHAGYLNWDTGHGPRRWHSAQYWAFAQQGLLAIAAAPQFWARPEYGRWAKALLDRGLLLYGRWGEETGGMAPQLPFDVFSDHRDQDLYATRIAANAMRAIALGLGDAPAAEPPPLYSFDRETGRLAVTTPSYSTAIVPDNRGAFAYGGIELARLFDGRQRVAATTGGTPPNAFGVVIRDAAGRTLLASQDGAARGARLHVVGARPPAGSFRELSAGGRVAAGALRIATTHRFRARDIDVRWDIRCDGRCGAIEVHLPTWGADAVIDVHARDGTHAPLAGAVPLAGVDRVELGAEAGYAVTPLVRPPGAVLFPVATAPQPTDPNPGPTLAIRLVAGPHVRATSLAVRISPRG